MLTPPKEGTDGRDKCHDTACMPYQIRENNNYFQISVCIPRYVELSFTEKQKSIFIFT